MRIELGSHLEGFVREQVESGRYISVSEVIRAGLRLLEDSERQQALRLEALRAAVAGGRASGPGRPAGPTFDRLKAKYDHQAIGKTT